MFLSRMIPAAAALATLLSIHCTHGAAQPIGTIAGIYVAEMLTTSSLIVRVDPDTGNRTKIAQAPTFSAPVPFEGFVVENSAKLLSFGSATVFRFDRQTGARSVVSMHPLPGSGPQLAEHGDIRMLNSGELLVMTGPPISAALAKIDLAAANRSVVSGTSGTSTVGSGPAISWNKAMYVERDGMITVADNAGNLFRIVPQTGDRDLLVSASQTLSVQHLDRLPGGDYIASGLSQLSRISPVTGVVQIVPGAAFTENLGMAAGPDGFVYVFDSQARKVYRVDPTSGSRTVLSSSDPAAPVGSGTDFEVSLSGALALDIASGSSASADPQWMLME